MENKFLNTIGKIKDKLVETLDQNDDGKLNFNDTKIVAVNIGSTIKKTANTLKETSDLKSKLHEEQKLKPIFDDTIEEAEFSMPKLIRLCERDRRRAESEVCKGSIGFWGDNSDLRVVNIFHENIDRFGLSFYPDTSYEFYYVDPKDRDRYIALDEYFSYLKIERINELQKLAQDLGAKHFRVIYKEEKASFTNKKSGGNVKAAGIANVELDLAETRSDYSIVEIAAEMECPGHEPKQPNLRYLQTDSSVQNLIAMRMDETSPLKHHRFQLNLGKSSGIKESDAIKIDAVLKAYKCSGNATVMSEVRNESKRILEYEIDF